MRLVEWTARAPPARGPRSRAGLSLCATSCLCSSVSPSSPHYWWC